MDSSQGGRIILMRAELPHKAQWGPLGPFKRLLFQKFLKAKGIQPSSYVIGESFVHLPTCVILRVPVVLQYAGDKIHRLIGEELTLKPLGSFWGAPIYLGELKEIQERRESILSIPTQKEEG